MTHCSPHCCGSPPSLTCTRWGMHARLLATNETTEPRMEDGRMQAITTKYIGPTDTRGSRVKAFTESGLSLTVGWNNEFNSEENHRNAAHALAKKLGWHGQWVGGGIKAGNVYVCVTRAFDDTFTVEKGE